MRFALQSSTLNL